MAYFYYTRLWHKFTFTFTLFVCVLVTKRRNLTKQLSVEFFDFLVAAFTDNAHELSGATTLESVLNYDVRHFYRAMLCIRGTSHGPVSVSVSLSQVGVLLKRLNVGSHKQHNTIAQGLLFSGAKDLRKIRPGSPRTRAPNAGGVGQNRRLLTNNRLYLENGTR